jgi:triacylglycerol lipase
MIHKSHDMAKCSSIAYLDEAKAKPAFRALGYKKCVFIEKDGAQCYVIWNQTEIVISFRGTEVDQISDVKADVNVFPSRAQNGHGLVHHGFQEELNKIWKDILELLSAHNDKPLYITGHSLGGAVATLATSRLYKRVTCLYTFGSPRTGTGKFVKSFSDIPHFRFVNNNDVVTKLPFALLGYRHHVAPTYINYYGEVKISNYRQRVKDQFRGRLRAWQKGQAFDGAYDHAISNYVRCTENLK